MMPSFAQGLLCLLVLHLTTVCVFLIFIPTTHTLYEANKEQDPMIHLYAYEYGVYIHT